MNSVPVPAPAFSVPVSLDPVDVVSPFVCVLSLPFLGSLLSRTLSRSRLSSNFPSGLANTYIYRSTGITAPWPRGSPSPSSPQVVVLDPPSPARW